MKLTMLVGIFSFAIACSTTALAAPQIKGLEANAPVKELADQLMLFGQFVGDWEFDMTLTQPDGTKVSGKGEWHFGWALGGRAVQDVWIALDDTSKPNPLLSEYGTTLRFYDPKMDVWRVVWVGPMRRTLITFIGRKVGDEIVMEVDTKEGSSDRGRWIFYDVTAQSFRWRAVRSSDGGKTWSVQQQMNVRRLK